VQYEQYKACIAALASSIAEDASHPTEASHSTDATQRNAALYEIILKWNEDLIC
jgi:hypothetical protein